MPKQSCMSAMRRNVHACSNMFAQTDCPVGCPCFRINGALLTARQRRIMRFWPACFLKDAGLAAEESLKTAHVAPVRPPVVYHAMRAVLIQARLKVRLWSDARREDGINPLRMPSGRTSDPIMPNACAKGRLIDEEVRRSACDQQEFPWAARKPPQEIDPRRDGLWNQPI